MHMNTDVNSHIMMYDAVFAHRPRQQLFPHQSGPGSKSIGTLAVVLLYVVRTTITVDV